APGLIEQKGTVQKLVFGEYDGTISPRALSLKAALEKADIEAVVVTDILSSLWQKFVVLVAMSSLTASVRQPIGPVRANAKTRELLQRVMEEVVAVATASGVKLPADLVSDRMAYLDGLAPDVTASMEYDLRVGNRLELPWLAGTVVALGKKLAVATPVSSTLCAILDPYVNGRS
ncbi:MAG TPA: ketopantoate reductase C-terminal domain-containing protein, partial [Candidatus Obscuribacter sp.]|nr:ketopantoate reductase C-terminal domain-containing protein [Candidatus Obscuribacter sp.]